MADLNKVEITDVGHSEETSVDLPDIPLESQTTEQLNASLMMEMFVSEASKTLKTTIIDKSVYKKMTLGSDGAIYYKGTKISKKGAKGLLAVSTLSTKTGSR